MDKPGSPDKTLTLVSTGSSSRMIGPYHLLEKIGEGGMGEVWVAEHFDKRRLPDLPSPMMG